MILEKFPNVEETEEIIANLVKYFILVIINSLIFLFILIKIKTRNLKKNLRITFYNLQKNIIKTNTI